MFGRFSGKSCPDGFEYNDTIDNDTVKIYKDGDDYQKNHGNTTGINNSKECINKNRTIIIRQTQEGNIYYIERIKNGTKYVYTKKFFDTNLDGRHENVYIKYEGPYRKGNYFCTIENFMPVYGILNDSEYGKYEGSFKDWYPDGKGIEIKSGRYYSKYEGEFKDGKYEGTGILTNDVGTYKGEFKDGYKHGTGELYENGKIKYKGQFNKGYYWGTGELYENGKIKYKGQFYEGKLYNGTVYEPHYHYDVKNYEQNGTWIVDDGFKECKDEKYPYKSIVGRIDPSKDDCLRENGRIVTEGKRINKKKRKSKFQKHKSKRGVNCSKKK